MPGASHPAGISPIDAPTALPGGDGEGDVVDPAGRFFAICPDLLVVAGPDGRPRRVNPAVRTLLGMSEDEFLGGAGLEQMAVDDRAEFARAIGRLGAGERSVGFEASYGGPGGSTRRISWTAQVDPSSGLIYSTGRAATATRDRPADRDDRERAAREAGERRYHAILESIPQVVWSAGPDGTIDHFNGRWYAYTGLGVAESLGWGWKPAIHPDDLAATVSAWDRAIRDRTPFEAEARLRRAADGADRYHLLRAEPVIGDGRLTGWFGTCTDIDDRRRAQQALVEQEERFRSLSEAMPQIVWIARPDGFHEYFNGRWYEYTGLDAEQSIGHGWSTPLHPDDVERSRRRWRQATASGEPYEIEYRFRRHDGRYRWFLGRAVPVREGGAVARWFGTCTDIDDQKRAAEELGRARAEAEASAIDVQAGRERFRNLVEAVPQLVWSCRPDGSCDYLSRQWVEYTGVPMERQVGYDWVLALHPDDREPAHRAWIEAARLGVPYDFEYRLRRHDGAYRWFNSRGVPARSAAGEVAGWFGTSTDIDDRKRIEAEVRSLNRDLEGRVHARTAELERANLDLREFTAKLESSNRELQEFASVASHDLQEPLRKIQAFGDRLVAKAGANLGPEGRDYLERMRSAAGRMRTLIDDLLAFSRVSTKAQPFVPIDLARVAREVVSDLEGRVAQTGGRVEVGPLPTIAADATQMRQLFQNLIGNGLKFMKPGQPPTIRVEARRLDPDGSTGVGSGRVELTFADDGIGFDVKYLDRIFNVFQRLHGRNEYEGTGMGLAIVRKIVERHCGTITARAEPGAGATFVVTLPAEHPGREECP